MKYLLNIKYLFFGVLLLSVFASCEDVVEIDTDPLTEQLVVDAWVNNLNESQTITLTKSQPYFENDLPKGVSGAVVQIISSDNRTFEFVEQDNGRYVWDPVGEETLGEVGTEYLLGIEVDGKQYGGVTTMNRVPAVDSITQEFRTDELGGPDGIYTQFFARDFIGEGDTYWIKTFKNGEFLNKPLEINFAFDAGFSPGAPVDGLIFIPPIRENTNRVPDPDTEDDSDVPPWEVEDEIRVEIHSISNEAFYFLVTAQRQMINGLNGIFSEPVINTPGNIIEVNQEEEVLGVFNVAAVSSLTKVIE